MKLQIIEYIKYKTYVYIYISDGHIHIKLYKELQDIMKLWKPYIKL